MFGIFLITLLCALCHTASYGKLPSNCNDATSKTSRHGVYQIQLSPESKPFYVYCQVGASKAGWTIIQKRQDGSISFNRTWNDYKIGFGNVAGEYFIGLEKLHQITQSRLHKLWVRLEDWNSKVRYAQYSQFAVGNEAQEYAIMLLGEYTGTAGDSLSYHQGAEFSTFDVDNDKSDSESCAKKYNGGWWFHECAMANLNGIYYKKEQRKNVTDGIFWEKFHGPTYSFKSVHMAIRPI